MPKFDRDILGRLADASNEEITAALAAIREDAAAFRGQTPTQQVLDTLKGLSDAADQLNGALTERAALADQAADLLSALTETPEPAPAAPKPETQPAPQQPVSDPPADQPKDDQPGNAPDSAPEGDKPGGEDDKPEDDTSTDDDKGEGAVTAAARRLGSNNTGAAPKRARVLPKVSLRTTAATNIPGHEVGSQYDKRGLLEAFHDKIRATMSRGRGGDGERYDIATIRASYPEERTLTASAETMQNHEKIEAAVTEARSWSAAENMGALTAAGLCAPLETIYDINVVGDTPRPVRDALVRFGVERGGITFRPPFEGVTQTGGIGFWTEANDTADPLVPKTCAVIDCPDLTEAQVQAIYKCLEFSNMTTRFDPEFMSAVVRAQDVAHARIAENSLLTQLVTGSKAVYSTKLLGAVRDTLVTLDKMIAYFRNFHRLADEATLRWIAPLWGKYLMRADIARQMVGDGLVSLAVADGMINDWFAARNVNVTWHLDGIDPADLTIPEPDVVVPNQLYPALTTGSAVPGFPDAMSTLLFQEGDWLWLDGGTLDMGTVRDSDLNSRNRFQTFSESFEGTAFRGLESFHLVVQTQPIGGSAATINTAAVTD